jgi:hypothetical protein
MPSHRRSIRTNETRIQTPTTCLWSRLCAEERAWYHPLANPSKQLSRGPCNVHLVVFQWLHQH